MKNMDRKNQYIAHYNEITDKIQSVSEHNDNVGYLAVKKCRIPDFSEIAELTGILHDAGKYSSSFQDYIIRSIQDKGSVHRGEVNHATAGGMLINRLSKGSFLSHMVQMAIYSHHGLYDCIDMSTGESIIEKRRDIKYLEQADAIPDVIEKRFYSYQSHEEIKSKVESANFQMKKILEKITTFSKNNGPAYGNKDFYLGMYLRMLLSLLVDADRTDTANFMDGQVDNDTDDIDLCKLWRECTYFFEDFMKQKTVDAPDTEINQCRRKISDCCKNSADKNIRLYRLTVPTGSGKTYSSLRFALHHAEKFGKQHIIYTAPYNSILEQNAKEIRKAVGNDDIVLEHHCSVINESDEDQKKYDILTQNWSKPMIVTTMVQLLNTLFQGKIGSIRRMHSLADSVIIIDEIQAIPVRTIGLFNLAVNFLTEFCNTTVVLCSATQPKVHEEIKDCRLVKAMEMAELSDKERESFRRTDVLDKTGIKGGVGGLTSEELGDFALGILPEEKQLLIIVNTKKCAYEVYNYLKVHISEECRIFHLSTNQCVLNRKEILDDIKAEIKSKEKQVICVSTQLIEAGVDISFRCVIRSEAGLDSIIQAAGRCNRNGELDKGNVYIVKMSEQAENVSRLKEIKEAKESFQTVLRLRDKYDCEDYFTSDFAIEQFYLENVIKQGERIKFPVHLSCGSTCITDLLSKNSIGLSLYRRYKQNSAAATVYKQAFKTAGELFEVIPENGKINVIVRYNSEIDSFINEILDTYTSISRRKYILKRLQLASVGISRQMLNDLGNAVTSICDGSIYILSKNYYSYETGVSTERVENSAVFV